MEQRMTPAAHRLCLWMGPALVIMYLFGFIFLAKFAPIPPPNISAAELVSWLSGHKTSYQLGCLLMLVAGGLLAPWGASLSIWTWKTESRFPVIFAAEIASLAAATGLFVIIAIFWGLASYRVGEISPEITQMLFDSGWFLFLWVGPPFYLWAFFFGLGTLWNPPKYQLFPRWIGFFTLASALCWSMGVMMIFFREGPTTFAGMLPTWIPLGDFFAWMVLVSVLGFRAIRRQEALCRDEGGANGVYAPTWQDPIEDPGWVRRPGLDSQPGGCAAGNEMIDAADLQVLAGAEGAKRG